MLFKFILGLKELKNYIHVGCDFVLFLREGEHYPTASIFRTDFWRRHVSLKVGAV